MMNSVWLLLYDVADENSQAYLDWFHSEHIPDKLARPGYDWAAHYRGPARSSGAGSSYLALFGARTTRTFLDPCPTQHRERQDSLTRRMMSHRIGTVSGIFIREWSEGEGDTATGADAPAVRVDLFNADSRDEVFGAWCAQTWLPSFRAAGNVGLACKYANVAGGPRHLVLTGHDSQVAAASPVRTPGNGVFGAEVADAVGSVVTAHGTRIWPPC